VLQKNIVVLVFATLKIETRSGKIGLVAQALIDCLGMRKLLVLLALFVNGNDHVGKLAAMSTHEGEDRVLHVTNAARRVIEEIAQ
jgi:hypothetical protein